MPQFFTCPHCGAEVPAKALACPSCGSDEETGWSEAARYAHLLPERESETLPAPASRPVVRWVAMALVVGVILGLLTMGGIAFEISLPVVVLFAIAVAGGYVAYRLLMQTDSFREKQLLGELLHLCRGDRDVAERLISYEQRRHPELSRLQAIESAVDRIKLDRR